MINFTSIKLKIIRGVSIAPLVVFRIFFGLLTLFSTVRFIYNEWVHELYIKPKFYFSYFGFEWIKPLPQDWMYLPFFLCILGSVGIILGAFFRFSSFIYFMSFTYIELIDKTNYLNHYYAVSLIAFILMFTPCHHLFSLDVTWKRVKKYTSIPAYFILILQLQIGIIYFYAGCAKINSDWLMQAEPLKTWLQAYRDLPLIGNWMASNWLAFVFSWFGCFYDLTIPFFLSWSKTRPFAYAAVVVFHIITWLLFPIGVFPWVMIVLATIYFPANFHEKLIPQKKEVSLSYDTTNRFHHLIFTVFIALQILLPWRYLMYPKGVFWHEEGFRFSWRVMLMQKEGYATFYVVDRKTTRSIEIENLDYLTPIQIDQMSTQPDMILQFGKFLGKEFKDTTLIFGKDSVHLQNPKVEAEVYVSLNGRQHQLMVSRRYDLTQLNYNLKHRKWIEPFQD